MDVAKCHACHAKQPSAISATPAAQNVGGCRHMPRHAKCRWVSPSASPATQIAGRGALGDQWAPSAPPDPAQCHKRRTCHAKCRWMSPSATKCRSAPGDQRAPSAPPDPAQCQSATPTTQNECWSISDIAKCHACHKDGV